MKKTVFVLLGATVLIFASCEKNSVESAKSKDLVSELSELPVAIYMVKTADYLPNKCEMDEKTIQIADEPIVSNEDIISYSEKDFTFTISDKSYLKLLKLPNRDGFVVTVAGDIAFSGIFKPLISQSVCEESVLMNFVGNNKINFFLGNPTKLSEMEKKTRVNNEFLIKALKNSKRLN